MTKESLQGKAGEMIYLPWTENTAPGAMIEITNACNLSCEFCYARHNEAIHHKTLREIARDMKAAQKARTISAISLSGGEPTLHPKLPEIIQLVKKAGLQCILCSNGMVLNKEKISQYAQCGLDALFLHIDMTQERTDLTASTEQGLMNKLLPRWNRFADLSTMATKAGIDPAWLWTTSPEEPAESWQWALDQFMNFPHASFFLLGRGLDIHLGKDTPDSIKQEYNSRPRLQKPVSNYLKKNYKLRKHAYLRSTVQTSLENIPVTIWYAPYSYSKNKKPEYYSIKTGTAEAILHRLPKLLTGKYIMKSRQNGFITSLRIGIDSLRPSRMKRGFSFLIRSWLAKARLRHKMIYLDDGPFLDEQLNVHCCECCPTATVRDGKLYRNCELTPSGGVSEHGKS